MDQPLRLGPKIDFQPQATDKIDELLKGDEPIPAPELLGVQLRGFAVLEYFLYGPGLSTLSSDNRACQFLVQTAADLNQNAQTLLQQWHPDGENFVAELGAYGQTGKLFESPHDALSAIVNRMGYVVENLRDRELHFPLGDSADSIRPDLIISRQSERSLFDIADSVRGVELLFFGPNGEDGISAYAKAQGQDFDKEVRALLLTVEDKRSALAPSLENKLTTDRDAVLELDAALFELQLFFQIEIIGRLSLSQIFNDADGD